MRFGTTSNTAGVAVLFGLFASLALIGVSSAATAPAHVSVYFLRGEQLARVHRHDQAPA
jgi:hypothetical protein